MSADLQFLILSKYNTFTLKRNGAVLSREPLNLTGLHRQRHTGAINPTAVNVVRNTDGSFELLHKSTDADAQYKPASNVQRTNVNDEQNITEIVDKHNPKHTPYVLAKFRALQRSAGPVSKTYKSSDRHAERAQKRYQRREAKRN